MLGWWYTLTTPSAVAPDAPFAQREQARRGRLTSTIAFGFLIAEIVVLLAGLHDPSFAGLIDGKSGFFILPSAIALTLLAMALNRYRLMPIAGILLAIVAEAPILTLMFFPANGRLAIQDIPIYYMLVISELVVVSILPPVSVFGVAAINSALIVGDLLLQPGSGAIVALLSQTDDTLTTLALPIALQLIVALVAYLWVGDTLQALRRADRADEIAALERREAEGARELEEGVRQLLEIHVQLSNGNFNVRAPAVRNQQLWHIGNSLNTLIARLSRLSQDSFLLQREREEARRLADAIQASRAGRHQVWPAPTGVPLDEVLTALNPRQLLSGGATPAPITAAPTLAPSAAPLTDLAYPSLYGPTSAPAQSAAPDFASTRGASPLATGGPLGASTSTGAWRDGADAGAARVTRAPTTPDALTNPGMPGVAARPPQSASPSAGNPPAWFDARSGVPDERAARDE